MALIIKHIRKIVLQKIIILLLVALSIMMAIYFSSSNNRVNINHELTWRSLVNVMSGNYFFEHYETFEVSALVKLSREEVLALDPNLIHQDYYLAKLDEQIILMKGANAEFEKRLNSGAIAQYNMVGMQVDIDRLSDITLDFNGMLIESAKGNALDREILTTLQSEGIKNLKADQILYSEEAIKLPRIVLLVILIAVTITLLLLYFMFFYFFPKKHRTLAQLKRRGIPFEDIFALFREDSLSLLIKGKRQQLFIFEQYIVILTAFNIKVISLERLIQLYRSKNRKFITFYEKGFSDFCRLSPDQSDQLMEHLQKEYPYLLLKTALDNVTLTQTKIPDRQGIEKQVLLRKEAYLNGLPLDYYLDEGNVEQETTILTYDEQQAIQRAYDESIS